MATNPLGTFLGNFASAYTGVRNMRGDPIREAQFAESIRRYDAEAPQREANLRMVEAQTEGLEMTNTVNREKIAAQQFAEAELRANELGGLQAALGDPVFKQRLLSATNTLGESAGQEMQIADYARLNRQNAQQWGLDDEQYEAMLMQHNPNHTPGADDDEIIVPLYKGRDGALNPLDLDGDGTLDTWSAQEAVDMIRGAFVGSDEYAKAMGSLYTGQPGVGGQGGQGGQTGQTRIDANANLAPPPEIAPMIQSAAEKHGVPANVVAAILHQESGYDPTRMNMEGSGAGGIAQYMPDTAARLGIDPMNPQQSIDATAMQLAEQLRNGASLQEAVMHHFAGPDRSGWGEKTATYGQEVMAKAALIGGEGEQRTTPRQRQQAISAEAITSANQVAAGPQESGAEGTTVSEPSPENAADLVKQEAEFYTKLYSRDAANAAITIPPAENESGETALGVPKEQMPENPSRGARRVAEGKGISPAQAKQLALDPSELPEPTPRATVAAGFNFLEGLEDDDAGGVFTSRGGGKPSHKQLTTAVILHRAGMIDAESLTRYADLGVISSSGVSVIQTGMQQVGQNQRQQMADNRSMQNEIIKGEYSLQKEREKRAAERDDLTFSEVRDQNILSMRNVLEADGNFSEEDIERISTQVGAQTSQLASRSRAFQRADFENPRMVEAVAKAQAFDRRWNSDGLVSSAIKGVRGVDNEMNLADNPLAILLLAEDSPIMELKQDAGFWEKIIRTDPGVDRVMSGMESVPRFVSVIQEPMESAARQAGAADMIGDPELQMRIYDIATTRIRQRIADEGRGILNDDEAIKREVMDATTEYARALSGGTY